MPRTYEELLAEIPAIAEAVNKFEGEEQRRQVLRALLDAFFGQEGGGELQGASDLQIPDDDTESPTTKDDSESPGPDSPSIDHPDWMKPIFEGVPSAEAVANGKRSHQTVWAVVYLTQRGDEASKEAVREIIRTEVGVEPQDPGNTSSMLSELYSDYLSRRQREEASGYDYFPNRNALDIFDDLKIDE